MFLVLYNSHDVRGENAPLFSYIAPTTTTMTTTPQMTCVPQSFWSPYEIENYICVLIILYVLFKLCKLFSQRDNKAEHGFNLGLDINGKHGECYC